MGDINKLHEDQKKANFPSSTGRQCLAEGEISLGSAAMNPLGVLIDLTSTGVKNATSPPTTLLCSQPSHILESINELLFEEFDPLNPPSVSDVLNELRNLKECVRNLTEASLRYKNAYEMYSKIVKGVMQERNAVRQENSELILKNIHLRDQLFSTLDKMDNAVIRGDKRGWNLDEFRKGKHGKFLNDVDKTNDSVVVMDQKLGNSNHLAPPFDTEVKNLGEQSQSLMISDVVEPTKIALNSRGRNNLLSRKRAKIYFSSDDGESDNAGSFAASSEEMAVMKSNNADSTNFFGRHEMEGLNSTMSVLAEDNADIASCRSDVSRDGDHELQVSHCDLNKSDLNNSLDDFQVCSPPKKSKTVVNEPLNGTSLNEARGRVYDMRKVLVQEGTGGGSWKCRCCWLAFATKDNLMHHICRVHNMHYLDPQGICNRKLCMKDRKGLTTDNWTIDPYAGDELECALRQWRASLILHKKPIKDDKKESRKAMKKLSRRI